VTGHSGAATALRHQTELGQVSPDGVGERGPLADLNQPEPVQHQDTLLLARLVSTERMVGRVTASQIAWKERVLAP
jgi:hypothetical protein